MPAHPAAATPADSRTASRALAGLLGGAILIGLAPIFVRLADVGPTAAAFWRTALATPLLLIAWAARWRRGEFARTWPMLLLAGACFAGDLGVWHRSIHYTSVADATLFANLAPIFVALAAWRWFGESIGARFVAGLLLALGGAAVLVSVNVGRAGPALFGDALGIAAAVFYAGYLLAVSRARRDASALAVMAVSTALTAALLLPAAAVEQGNFWPQSAQGWGVLLAMAWLSHAAGQGLIAWALAHLPAAFSSVTLLVQPVAATAFAWRLLGEPFGARQALGAAVVLAGILLCRRAA